MLAVLAGAFALAGTTAFAQSTVYFVPTTDVVEKRHAYVEFDFQSHLESKANGGYQAYMPRVIYGLAKGVEVGFNLGITSVSGQSLVCLQPNVKWQVRSSERSTVALAVGYWSSIPVKEADASPSIGVSYFSASRKIPGRFGSRFTGGVYGLNGPGATGTDKGGVMAGYEQPLSKRLSLIADWHSGKNRVGYVTSGLSFVLPRNAVVNVGYSVGNSGRKNNSLFMFCGIAL